MTEITSQDIVVQDAEITLILQSKSNNRAALLMERYRLNNQPDAFVAALVGRVLLAYELGKAKVAA